MGKDELDKVLFLVLFLIQALMALMAIPLVLEMVPPNGAYGVRTAASFTSNEAWYAINFRAGVGMLVSSVLSVPLCFAIVKFVDKSRGYRGLYALGGYFLLLMISLSIADQGY